MGSQLRMRLKTTQDLIATEFKGLSSKHLDFKAQRTWCLWFHINSGAASRMLTLSLGSLSHKKGQLGHQNTSAVIMPYRLRLDSLQKWALAAPALRKLRWEDCAGFRPAWDPLSKKRYQKRGKKQRNKERRSQQPLFKCHFSLFN